MYRPIRYGFTLIELLIVISIIAVISGYAIPTIIQSMMQRRSTAVIDKFVATFDLAKNEAIRRGDTISICSAQINSNGVLSGCRSTLAESQLWEKGLLVYIDYNRNGSYGSGDKVRLAEFDSSVAISGPTNQSSIPIGFNTAGEFYNGTNSSAIFCTTQSFYGLTTYQTQIMINAQGIVTSCVVGTTNCVTTCVAG